MAELARFLRQAEITANVHAGMAPQGLENGPDCGFLGRIFRVVLETATQRTKPVRR